MLLPKMEQLQRRQYRFVRRTDMRFALSVIMSAQRETPFQYSVGFGAVPTAAESFR
jgi:hypothetical protein